jgi:hypothetical protein
MSVQSNYAYVSAMSVGPSGLHVSEFPEDYYWKCDQCHQPILPFAIEKIDLKSGEILGHYHKECVPEKLPERVRGEEMDAVLHSTPVSDPEPATEALK